MTTITANHLFTRLTDHSTTQGRLADTAGIIKKHAGYTGKFIKNFAIAISGTAVIGVMGIGKSIAPDHTFFDRFSLVGIILGAITAIFGATGLYRGEKEVEKIEVPPTPFTIKDTVAKDLSDLVKEVSGNPNDRFKISNNIVDGNRAANLRTDCYDLVKKWADPVSGFIDKLESNENKSVLEFIHGNGTNSNITSTELKERFALLIGYIIGSRGTAPIASDAPSNDILTDINKLVLAKIEKGESKWEALLPDEFTLLFSAASHYKEKHMDTETSIKTEFQDKINLTTMKTSLSSPRGSTPKDTAKKQIGEVINSRNYLKSLQKGIEFVIQVEGERKSGKKVDSGRQRDADILRNALVAGLQLMVKDRDDTVKQLDAILKGHADNKPASAGGTTGTQKGLNEKIGDMDKFWANFENTIRSSTNEISINPVTLKFPLFNQANLLTLVAA